MGKANILAVMENVLEADQIQGWINSWGYRVISPDSVQGEPGKIKREINPDLILIDKLLKENSLFKGVQRIQEHLNIPVIYIASSFDKETLENSELTEDYVCLLKPVDPQELKFTMEMALYKHKMEKRLTEKEAWLSTTLRSIGDGVITTDVAPVTSNTTWSAIALDIWKFPPEALVLDTLVHCPEN